MGASRSEFVVIGFQRTGLAFCSEEKLPGHTAGLSCCAGLTLRRESIYTQDIRLGA